MSCMTLVQADDFSATLVDLHEAQQLAPPCTKSLQSRRRLECLDKHSQRATAALCHLSFVERSNACCLSACAMTRVLKAERQDLADNIDNISYVLQSMFPAQLNGRGFFLGDLLETILKYKREPHVYP